MATDTVKGWYIFCGLHELMFPSRPGYVFHMRRALRGDQVCVLHAIHAQTLYEHLFEL